MQLSTTSICGSTFLANATKCTFCIENKNVVTELYEAAGPGWPRCFLRRLAWKG